jgi:hypothetical protein
MRVILHDLGTDLYFVGANMWSNDHSKALNFEHMDQAFELARRTGLEDLELVICINRAGVDIHMPVTRVENYR